MKKIKCLIVDDEAPARRIIEGYLQKIEDAEVCGLARNSVEAYNFIQKTKPDVLFLDINMPEISGIGLLKMLETPPVIILTTAYAEYGAESYDYNVADYLLKPIRFERFVKAMNKARTILSTQELASESKFTRDHFQFRVGKELKTIPAGEIFYLQSLGNYIKVITKQKTFLTMLTTHEAEIDLQAANFLRVHKSFIINPAFVEKIDTDKLIINQTEIPIGKTFRKYVSEKLQNKA